MMTRLDLRVTRCSVSEVCRSAGAVGHSVRRCISWLTSISDTLRSKQTGSRVLQECWCSVQEALALLDLRFTLLANFSYEMTIAGFGMFSEFIETMTTISCDTAPVVRF
jgi:hypothetical protein